MTAISRRTAPTGRALFPFDLLRWDPFAGALGEAEPASSFSASFDVLERPDSFILTADLPGVAEDDLSITLQNAVLSISGKRESEEKKEGERFFSVERRFGSFTRSFQLPEGTQDEHISAALKDGVLQVTVKKPGDVKPRAIKVNR